MNKQTKIASVGASAMLSLIVLFGILGLFLVIPSIAADLVGNYSEYSGDQALIQVLLSAPVVITIAVFGQVIALLRMLARNNMLSYSAFKWVKGLGYSAATLAVSFGALFSFLLWKNTMPPSIGFVIIVLILFSSAVSLVTFSLLGLLKSATETKLDLEGVI